jgi:hypothetical protein
MPGLTQTRCTVAQTRKSICVAPTTCTRAATATPMRAVGGGAWRVAPAPPHQHSELAHQAEAAAVTRRGFFALVVGTGLYLNARPSFGEGDGEFKKFLGYSVQPDLYLVGGGLWTCA